MRRDRAGRKNDAKTTRNPNKSSRPPRRKNNEKEDDQPSIPASLGLIFMALCLSALSSGLKTAKDLTPKSETTKDKEGQTDESRTTIDPKEGQTNISGAEKNPNATITPPAIPTAPTTTPPAPTSLIQRFFAFWANSTPTKEDNTKIKEVAKKEDTKDAETHQPVKKNKTEKDTSVIKNPWQRKGNFIPIPQTPNPFEKPEISPELAEKIEESNDWRNKLLERDLRSHMLAFAKQNEDQNSALRSADRPPAPRNPDNKPSKRITLRPRDIERGPIRTGLIKEGLLPREGWREGEPMGGGTRYGHVPPPKGSRGR